MTTHRPLIATLLLCCTASADDRDPVPQVIRTEQAEPAVNQGPLFSIWHIDGHGYQWQQNQIDAGLPLEPSIRMVHSVVRNVPKQTDLLNSHAPVLSIFNNSQIVLRMNNIGPEIDDTIPRISPLTEETWRQSHMCIRRLPDGTLDDTPTVCPFAGTAAWTEAGRQWATSLWMTRLQEIIPEPTGVILRENNEGGRIAHKGLYLRLRVRKLNSKGVLVMAGANDPQSTWVDPPPSPDLHYRIEPGSGVWAYRWLSPDEADRIDLRAKEWIAERQGEFPPDSLAEFVALENAQYQALYTAFDTHLSPAWQGKLRTVGYGGFDENRQNDAASPAMYLGSYRSPDLTTPGAYAITRFDAGTEELEAEADNPNAWREYSIAAAGTQKAIYAGAVTGTHAVVDPDSFAGLMSHVAWRMQAPGREVRLVYWDNYNVKPTHLIFATTTNGTTFSQTSVDALTGIGREDMLGLTIEDYELAVLRALARIHDHPTLNRYWREGTTFPLESPLNTPTSVKVYATETKIPYITQTLLCVYTPCDLSGEIQVGEWTVPAKRFGYWLTGSIQEIE